MKQIIRTATFIGLTLSLLLGPFAVAQIQDDSSSLRLKISQQVRSLDHLDNAKLSEFEGLFNQWLSRAGDSGAKILDQIDVFVKEAREWEVKKRILRLSNQAVSGEEYTTFLKRHASSALVSNILSGIKRERALNEIAHADLLAELKMLPVVLSSDILDESMTMAFAKVFAWERDFGDPAVQKFFVEFGKILTENYLTSSDRAERLLIVAYRAVDAEPIPYGFMKMFHTAKLKFPGMSKDAKSLIEAWVLGALTRPDSWLSTFEEYRSVHWMLLAFIDKSNWGAINRVVLLSVNNNFKDAHGQISQALYDYRSYLNDVRRVTDFMESGSKQCSFLLGLVRDN